MSTTRISNAGTFSATDSTVSFAQIFQSRRRTGAGINPGVGFGTGINFNVINSSNSNPDSSSAAIQAVSTNITSGSETFDDRFSGLNFSNKGILL